MSNQVKSEHQSYHFKVGEYSDGTPYITTEPKQGEIKALENKLLSFALAKGTTFEQAQEIAKYLNKNISTISVTTFPEA